MMRAPADTSTALFVHRRQTLAPRPVRAPFAFVSRAFDVLLAGFESRPVLENRVLTIFQKKSVDHGVQMVGTEVAALLPSPRRVLNVPHFFRPLKALQRL